ncbi:hypothetical protein CHS0354_016372 [Potamilus streckersoni]|uniref:Novel STAND NTPase 3 domain-containing protein n=1 Tax=Potamilus streckersoni TaxID=2493646 RepID=A0AAE0W2X4_9BIVA|nr:hypothetical protein CHS0354_016372 [Potamilus streckersoni]
MSTPARFSDGQYKNWLKCSHSLIIMKEALHDYIDNEVNKLHGDIQLKVSSISCGSPTVTQCGCCSWKNIKITGGKHGNWYINCKNSICDKWLPHILAIHVDPQNPTINWKNADISKWPIDGYQVAKIYMPKGQDKTTKMPEELDSPAILSLMKYCNWFRKDLPNTQILFDLIDIRNKVLHSGDLKVADADKNCWIDLMIQLLSDLNIHGDVKTEVQMLKREDIDINFRETEIRVLQNLVSGLANDLTLVKDDMECLQKLQSQLSEEVEHLRENSTETTRNVDTLDTDIQRMKASLDELKIISDKMMTFFDKNPDIYDIEITEIIRNNAKNVQEQQGNLSRLETELLNVKVRLSKLEDEVKLLRTNQEEANKELKGLKKQFEEQKEHDEQSSLQKGAPRKKRPETDGLKQLKYHTEDKLDTLKRLQYIPTKQAEIAKTLLERNRSVVIKGNPGEGKTTTALHLIDNEIYRDKRVVLNYPKEWKKVDTDSVDIVVIEDIFGQFDLDPARLQEWIVYLPTIQEHIDVGKISVIVTTRVDILLKAYSNVESLKLFSDDISLTLSSEQLTNSEKTSIFNRELQRHKRNMEEDGKKECIINFGGLIGFPQCCALFSGDIKSFDRGPEFFRSPERFFVANITELDNTRFLCLAFLFCNGKLWEEHLSPETMPETGKCLLMELAFHLHIPEKEASITLLRLAYDSFLDLYIVKSMSYDYTSYVEKSCIKFTHATVCEAVGKILGDRCVEMVIKYGNSDYLYQRTYTAPAKDGTSQNVFIPVSVYRSLAKRMVYDVVHVNRGLVVSIVKYSAFRQHNFLKELKCELLKDNLNKSFFMSVQNLYLPFYEDYDGYDDNNDDDNNDDDNDDDDDDNDDDDVFDLSERKYKKSDSSKEKCDTFMQYILKSDVAVVRLVSSQLLEFLACPHTCSKKRSKCWQCREKTKLLELALYYHHFEIADKLITMNACYTHVCLCNTARHGDLERVQTILETLKRRHVFNPGCKEAKDALFRAYVSENQNLIDLLLKEHIILDSRHVVDAVRHGNMKVIIEVVEHLKFHKKWNPHWEKPSRYIYWNCFTSYWQFNDVKKQSPCSTALILACFHETFDMADYLLKNEVQGSMYMLLGVSQWSSQQVVARMIQALKDSNSWNPMCDEATEALENAYTVKRFSVCDLLVQEGVSLTMKTLTNLVDGASFEYITKTIQNMKDTDNWDPKCDVACKALEMAYRYQHHDVCDLLVQEGVSLTMKNLSDMVHIVSFESIKKSIKNMKDTDNWDPKCDDASKALEKAYKYQKYDVCDLLVAEGFSLTMKNLLDMVFLVPFEYIKKAIQNMQVMNNWNPMCDLASKALKTAYGFSKYNVCDLLVEEGVSLTMKNLSNMVYGISFESIKKAIQNMKKTDIWDCKSDEAYSVLESAYRYRKNDVCELLIQEGVSLQMSNLPNMVHSISFEYIKKEIKNMKDTGTWDPKCDDASKALAIAYRERKYDVCDLLFEEGVSLTMKNLLDVVFGVSLDNFKKAIQNMKDTNNWDPKCDYASKALENAYRYQYYDVCDLLVEEGVSLTMQYLPYIVCSKSFVYIKNAIQKMKDTNNWDSKCDDANKALENAYRNQNYNVCDLLFKEEISITMKNIRDLVHSLSFESIKKAIQNMKDTDNWDPKCDGSS